MYCKSYKIIATVALALVSGTAIADITDMLTLRGYGTLGLAYSDNDTADFVTNLYTQTDGVGRSDTLSYKLDSRVALQADFKFSERFSGVVQLVSEAHENNSWSGSENKEFVPSLEWANLSFRATDNLTIRGGRIVLPLFMVSEYRKVGFANHWMRPPVEVYGNVPFTSSDGGDITYKSKSGNAVNTARVHWGTQSMRTYADNQIVAYGINDTFEIGALTLRAAYMHVDFKSTGAGFGEVMDLYAMLANDPSLGGAYASAGNEAIRLRKLYNTTDKQKIDYVNIGFIYDKSNFLLMGEVMRGSTDGIVGTTTAGYLSGGYRIKAFTPYVTYAQIKSKLVTEAPLPALPIPGLPPPPAPIALIALGIIPNAIITDITSVDYSQKTISLGVRWDVADRFDIKAQIDHIDTGDRADGLLRTRFGTQAAPEPITFVQGSSMNVFSIAVDFVF